MNKLVVSLALVGGSFLALGTGCSKERVKECDEFVATMDKLASCEKLPADARKQIGESSKMIKDALKQIDDAGGTGNAPKDLVDQMRDTCKTQTKTVVDEYTKLMPDCLK